MPYTLSICANCQAMNKIDTQAAQQKTSTCGKCHRDLPMHGLVSEVTGEGLQRILAKADKPVIVDFWATWCGPCRIYGPVFEKASLKNTEAIFLKINTEKEAAFSNSLGIRGIPTTILYDKGTEKQRQPGALPEEMIEQLIHGH